MKSSFIKYFYIIFIIITLGIIFTGCGEDNNIITPVTNNPQNINQSTPPPQTITKHVAGYIYATSGQGSMAENFIILDVPATGQDSFPAQMSDYLQQNYPADWNKPEIQEIYNQLSSEMVQWKPLLQYNSSAQLFTLYSDSPISVNSDGYFEADVPVQSTDDTVGFEVVLNDKEHFSVNRTSFADLLTSTGGTDGQLKSCSKTVFALPGGITIFKIFATAMNLKESGLTFSLDNSSIGTITPPFYLKIKGQENFTIAYGVFKAVNNASGMAKTGTIDAKTSNGVSGQNIPMPVEIIHETVSISGKVFTDGSPLIDGHVKSIGPKSFCHLDNEGNYILPEVFEGTNREIIATWWTDESGKRTKHVEIKYIDLLNGNLTDFNFGLPPEPTPTFTPIFTPTPTYPPPTDKYYDRISSKIIDQKLTWQEELGWIQGIQKTVDWLNGNTVADIPLPFEIAEAIKEAKIDEYDPYTMLFSFKSGVEVSITDPKPYPLDPNTFLRNRELHNNNSPVIMANTEDPIILKNKKVLMLGPKAFEDRWCKDKLLDTGASIKSAFENKYAKENVDCFAVLNYTIPLDFPTPHTDKNILNDGNKADVDFTIPTIDPDNYEYKHTVWCHVVSGHGSAIPRPQNFENMNDYSLVFIDTHGLSDGLMACPYYEGDEDLENWLNNKTNKPKWRYGYAFFSPVYPLTDSGNTIAPPSPATSIYYKSIILKRSFFLTPQKDFTGTFVYANGCDTMTFFTDSSLWNPFYKVNVYIGFNGDEPLAYSHPFAYDFFRYMLAMNTDVPPMNVRNAFNKALEGNPNLKSPLIDIYTGSLKEYDNTYLAGDVNVVLTKK